jgi:hypothetical protein
MFSKNRSLHVFIFIHTNDLQHFPVFARFHFYQHQRCPAGAGLLHVFIFICTNKVLHFPAFSHFHFHRHQQCPRFSGFLTFSFSAAPTMSNKNRPSRAFIFICINNVPHFPTFAIFHFDLHPRRPAGAGLYTFSFSPASEMFSKNRSLHVFILTSTNDVPQVLLFARFHFDQHQRCPAGAVLCTFTF